MNRIWKPFVVVLAAVYFVADAIFATVAHPLSRWLSHQRLFSRLRTWIRSLRPYPSLALFLVPVIILEPVKPGNWPENFFEAIRIDDPTFDRPDQGATPPLPPLD